MKQRYKETRELPPAGFSRVIRKESRVVEVSKPEDAPNGAVETTEPVSEWALVLEEAN